MNAPVNRVMFLVCCLAVIGCSAGSRSSDNHAIGSVDTLNWDLSRATDPSDSTHSQARWRIAVDLVIDRPEDGSAFFGQIVAIAAGPGGDIAVADGTTQQVQVFDRSGQHRHSLGRKGAGPGEFGDIIGLTWSSSGILWVVDAANARYSLFDSAGKYLGQRPRRMPAGMRPWLGGFGPGGDLYDVAFRPRADGGTEFSVTELETGNASQVAQFPPLIYSPSRPEQSGNAAPPVLSALMPRFTFAFDPKGYLWFGTTDRYRIVQRRLSGDTVRVISLATERPSVTEAEKDSVEQQLARESGRYVRPWTRRDIPDRKPAFARLFVDDNGDLIVQPTASPAEDGRLFDLFDNEGRYRGRAVSDVPLVTSPARAQFTKDLVYAVTVDSAGAQQVVRGRISPSR